MAETSRSCKRIAWRHGCAVAGTRWLAEECAVAISYNGSTHAVLMATPANLEDLAIGFSFTEGIVTDISLIENIDVVEYDLGLDIQVSLRSDIADRLAERRRSMTGPVGCGLCGLESLEAASRALPPVRARSNFTTAELASAVRALVPEQRLNAATGAAHAAGYYVRSQPVALVREDVGRHNALDKLIGSLLRAGLDPSPGCFVVTSRVSVELVQKTAIVGCGVLAAVSAPTALAVETARKARITLAGIVRGDDLEIFSWPDRIADGAVADVA